MTPLPPERETAEVISPQRSNDRRVPSVFGENEMVIRRVKEDDVESFYRMMCLLDEETDYMLYEPGERQVRTTDLTRLKATVKDTASGQDLLLVAENDNGEIVGYIWAERGRLNRIKHTAYIVVGIRRAYQHQGIGTEFFRLLENWGKENGIVRLELTVECENTGAKSLYEKYGFVIEGLRPKSMKVDGRFVDEYYMGRVI